MGLSFIFVFKQKTAYEMRISDWSSDVCSSDLPGRDALDRTSTGIDHGVEEIGVWHLVDHAAVSRTVPENAREVTAAHDIGLGRVGVDDELGDRTSAGGGLARAWAPILARPDASPAMPAMALVLTPSIAGTPKAPRPVATRATPPSTTPIVFSAFDKANSFGLDTPTGSRVSSAQGRRSCVHLFLL